MYKIISLLFFYTICFNLYSGCNGHDKVIFCNFFLRLSNDEYRFDISNVDPTLCTHLLISYASLEQIPLKVNGSDLNQYLALKEGNKDVKIILGIGGWLDGSSKYSKMAADPQSRKTFVENVLNILENQKIDGVDLAWDTPTLRDGKPEDKANHATLLKELSEALKPKGYLLIATIRANKDDLTSIFDLGSINEYVDYVNVLLSEYHMASDGVVGANAPLPNVESSLSALINNGLSGNKVVLSLPARGHTFILNDPETKEVVLGETKSKKEGFAGRYINQTDYIAYFEVCLELKHNASLYWDEVSSTPYLRNKEEVIAFDNPRSIANKVKLAIDHDLAGVSIYTLPTEDYKGVCDEDTDAYKDYISRYNSISQKQSFKEALVKLFLEGSDNDYYVISENKVNLRVPTTKFSKYPLLNTVNKVIPLALEEKKVLAEIKKIDEGQSILCHNVE